MANSKHTYDSPEVMVLTTNIEGVLCESKVEFESVGENLGSWDGI